MILRKKLKSWIQCGHLFWFFNTKWHPSEFWPAECHFRPPIVFWISFLQKFLPFCPFLIIFFSQNQNQTKCHKILSDDFLGLKEHPGPILAGRISFSATNFILNFGQFWKIRFFSSKTVTRQTFLVFREVVQLLFLFKNSKYGRFLKFLGY